MKGETNEMSMKIISGNIHTCPRYKFQEQLSSSSAMNSDLLSPQEIVDKLSELQIL